MWLTEQVALVGSGDIGGMGLTNPFDCHVYLLDGGDECALIDAGAGFDGDAIVMQIEGLGIDPARVRHLLLTHAHFDHAGGAAALARRLKLRTVAGAECAARLSAGDEDAIGLTQARALGLYPAQSRLAPCPIDRIVTDGESFRVGNIEVTALHTPGHSGDHFSFLARGDGAAMLFAGDAVFAGGRIALQTLPDCRLADCFATIRRLATLEVEMLLPGHGVPVLRRGDAHLRKALGYVDAMQVPPSMFF